MTGLCVGISSALSATHLLGRLLINAQIACPLLGVKRQHLLGVSIFRL